MEVRSVLNPLIHILNLVSHSFRFEHKLGPRLKVVALIDPSTARADRVLDGKRQSFVESAYRDTLVFKTIEDYYQYLQTHHLGPPQQVKNVAKLLS